jgi:hypothetical protein
MGNVAIIMAGHLRSFEMTSPQNRALLFDPTQADIFLSTHHMVGLSSHIDAGLERTPTSTKLNRINELLKPVKLEVERTQNGIGRKFDHCRIDNRSADGVVSRLNKVWRANQLRKNHQTETGRNYDAVIFFRPDCLIKDCIDLSLLNSLEKDTLYLPKYGHWSGLSDIFAMGDGTVADKYADAYARLDDITKKVPLRPEDLLKQHIKDCKLKVRFFDIDYVIQRCNGEQFSPREHSSGLPKIDW